MRRFCLILEMLYQCYELFSTLLMLSLFLAFYFLDSIFALIINRYLRRNLIVYFVFNSSTTTKMISKNVMMI